MPLPGQGLDATIAGGQTLLQQSQELAAGKATVDPSTGVVTGPSAFKFTTGWYVFFGVAGGVLVSGTRVAPVALGILTVALLFQITQLIEGK